MKQTEPGWMDYGLWDETKKTPLYFIIQMSCHKQLYSYLA